MSINVSRSGNGLGEWLIQRLTAVYLGGFVVWLGFRLWLVPVTGFDDWRLLMSGGAVRIAFAAMFASLILHAWVGVRSILLDYVGHFGWRVVVQAVVILALAGCAFWAAQILLVDAVR